MINLLISVSVAKVKVVIKKLCRARNANCGEAWTLTHSVANWDLNNLVGTRRETRCLNIEVILELEKKL